jgi:hypothetical protein
MVPMRSSAQTTILALVLATASLVLLGGCGSSTKTVSVASSPALEQTTSTATTSTQKAPKAPTGTSTTSTPAPTSTAGDTSAPSTTRTAPEPAFTQQESHAEGVSGAAALVRAKGFTPNDTAEYHSTQTLRVLLGTRTGSGDGYGQLAFFFLGDRYIGTDTKEPSATLKVISQSDTEVTLAYPLYRKGDPLSTPSGGQASVRFQLNNGKLTPTGTIPPANSSSGLSRF